MKKIFGIFSVMFFTALLTTGCETVRTETVPEGAYNIRKPADTTRAVEQEEGVLIERVY